jgi:hypothetical protein
MKHIAFLPRVSLLAVIVVFSSPVFSASPELEEALALARQIHPDECEQHHLRGQLLMAHQSHDEEKLDTLGPRLEAVNQRLKPSEDRLKALKLRFGKNPGEQSSFDAALQEAGDCD